MFIGAKFMAVKRILVFFALIFISVGTRAAARYSQQANKEKKKCIALIKSYNDEYGDDKLKLEMLENKEHTFWIGSDAINGEESRRQIDIWCEWRRAMEEMVLVQGI